MGHPRWLAGAAALALAWTMQPATARQAQAAPQAPQPYGPVLYVNGKPVTDPARRNPAEVHDEADTGANPAAQPVPPQTRPQQQGQPQGQQARKPHPQAARRHRAWQPNGPMAPRPLHGEEPATAQDVPLAPPIAAPQPLTPSSNVLNGCQGGFCTDASGNSYNGLGTGATGNAGVSSTGRLCSRSGATVQCF